MTLNKKLIFKLLFGSQQPTSTFIDLFLMESEEEILMISASKSNDDIRLNLRVVIRHPVVCVWGS